jgi:hypothetical protein
MKYLTLSLAILGIFCGFSWCEAAPFETFSGLLPADKLETNFFMYLKTPKKLAFEVSDAKGAPMTQVRVVEVNLTSADTVKVKNPDGILSADLAEAGIYEIKVQNTAKTSAPLGFTLKIQDLGAAAVIPPVPGPTAAVMATPMPPATPTPPATTVAPSPTTMVSAPTPAAPATAEPVRSPVVSADESIPVLNLPPKNPPPALTPAPTGIATSPAGSDATPVAPVATVLPTPAVTPAPTVVATPVSPGAAGLGRIIEKSPLGIGFADPFKPFEIRFDRALPAGIPVERIMKVYCLNQEGREEPVEGRYFPLGTDGLRFVPARLVPGAVYHVVAQDPETNRRLDRFTVSSLPEIAVSMSKIGAEWRIELDWKSRDTLMPSADSQVIRLESGALVLKSRQTESFRLAFSPDLAPSGTLDGVTYNSRPFHFELRIPETAFPFLKEEFSAHLLLPMIGREQPVEIARATWKGSTVVITEPVGSNPLENLASPGLPLPTEVASSATFANTVADPGVVTTPPLVSASAAVVIPASETAVVAAAPTTPPVATAGETINRRSLVSWRSVGSTGDPGLKARVVYERKILVTEGATTDLMSWPKGLAWSADGSLWVTDSQNRRVLNFSEEGDLIIAFGRRGRRFGFLGLPIDLALSGDKVLVSDTANHCVHVFDQNGNSLRDIGVWGSKAGQLDLPYGIDMIGDELVIADRGNCRIERFSLDGKHLGGFGRKGELPGYIKDPIALKVHNEQIWIFEGELSRLQRFSKEGKILGSFIEKGLKSPSALDIDPWGYPWIADDDGHRVYRLDQTGKVLNVLDTPPTEKPWKPTAIAVRADGLVAVADGEARAVHLFRIQGQ